MNVIDIDTERRARRGQEPAVEFDALHRYNDLVIQVHQHEQRELSRFEVQAVVYSPHELGLGHGPLASLHLNPAV